MSVHFVAKSIVYKVASDSAVTVQVVIGDAQGGGWVVAWDDQHVIAKGSASQPVEVGLGKEIAGRALQVVATAVDTNGQTNRLSSMLTVDGGTDGSQQLVSTWNDGADGDAAVFATMIGFQ
jgi:hypothetical protein